jgi:hypothetical protein
MRKVKETRLIIDINNHLIEKIEIVELKDQIEMMEEKKKVEVEEEITKMIIREKALLKREIMNLFRNNHHNSSV